MGKYSVRICSCGRIHLTDNNYLEYLREDYQNRRVYNICSRCGISHEIRLDAHDEGFDICTNDVQELSLDSATGQFRVNITEGIPVPMMSGMYADCYRGGRFLDSVSYWSEEGRIHDEDAAVVDMDRFIREVGDDEKLKSISGLVCKGLNWKGTAYEH